MLVTGHIKVVNSDSNTNVTLKDCLSFTKCITHINDEHIAIVENLDIIIPMYNLIEYCNNYSDTSGSL